MTNICVIGLGRIGLPLALVSAGAGHRVVGVDKNSNLLYDIRNSNLCAPETHLEGRLLKDCFEKSFFVSNDLQTALCESQVVFIAVGTNINHNKTADLTDLFDLVSDLCNNMENVKGRLFIFKCTVPIGTTRKVTKIMEEKTGLKCGKDFFVVFSPERVLGDKAIIEMQSLPKIIGGMDEESSKRAVEVYNTIGGKIIIVDSPEAAEFIKLMDNAYRQTMFAFANDIALVAEKYGLDAYELIEEANDSYPRNNIPPPSAGVSGYCLTKDPLYLEEAFKNIAKERGFPSVWYSARRANDYMPGHVVDLLNRELVRAGRSLQEANVLVCGISYKENTDDIRHSHGIEIAKKLEEMGANVFIWDPEVRCFDLKYPMVNNIEEVIENMDALVFTVKHDEFVKLNNNDEILHLLKKIKTPMIVDGWGIFRKLRKEKTIYYVGVGISNSRYDVE